MKALLLTLAALYAFPALADSYNTHEGRALLGARSNTPPQAGAISCMEGGEYMLDVERRLAEKCDTSRPFSFAIKQSGHSYAILLCCTSNGR
jgi:hypothetical protein